LGIATGDESYFEKAKNLYAKQRQYLYESSTGKVFDSGSWNEAGTVFTVGNYWVSTYNQGTFLGAALMLYNHYGTAQYKNDAQRIVEWTRNDLCNAHGIVRVCGNNDDLQGFKGILMRYLRRYVVDLALPDKAEWLQDNALHAYNNRNSKGITWTAWWDKAPESFKYPDGYSFSDKSFGCSTAVSAAFNAPLSADLIIKNAFQTIEAENFDYVKGIYVNRSDDETAIVENTNDNFYTAYNNVDFGEEAAIEAEFLVQNNARQSRQIEIHLDNPTGTLLGTAEIPTGSSDWFTINCDITPIVGRHNIYLVYKGSGSKIDSFRFKKEGNGIENVALTPPIGLYPNPATTELNVNFSQAGRLSIYNSLGQEIDAINIPAGTTTLNVNHYKTGMYLVNMITNNGIFISKFLKK
jgi:hypothetical protein